MCLIAALFFLTLCTANLLDCVKNVTLNARRLSDAYKKKVNEMKKFYRTIENDQQTL